jgi:uncharacterized membrane protein YphA (DoxX/SURF4 family)
MLRRSLAWWQQFLLEPQPATPLALVRIVYGVLLSGWGLSVLLELEPLFGPDRYLNQPQRLHGMWPLLPNETPLPVMGALALAVIGAGVLVAVGLFTRAAAAVGFIGMLTLHRHAPLALNGGDLLLRLIGFSVMVGDAGAALSVDRWRRAPDRWWVAPLRAPWALRLIQLQLSIGYLGTVVWKLTGFTWRDGLAVGYALQVESLRRFTPPPFLYENLTLVNLMTYGTLAVEVGVGVLVWSSRWRRFVIPLGLLLHLFIDVFLTVGFFSLAMYAVYLSFAPPARDVRSVLPRRVRARLTRRSQPSIMPA